MDFQKRILFCTRFFSFSVTWFWNRTTFSHWHMLSSDGLSVGNENNQMRRYFCPWVSFFSYLSHLALFLTLSLLSFPTAPQLACRDYYRCGGNVVRSVYNCRVKMTYVYLIAWRVLLLKYCMWLSVAAGGSDAPFLWNSSAGLSFWYNLFSISSHLTSFFS